MILGGSVTVNGQICQNLATDISESDFVKVGSRRVLPEKPLTILLHKPRGYLCTASDTHERRTVFDLLPAQWPRLFHVGRLDRDSEGLLILTNDGDLSLKLTHPRYKIKKEYEVLLNRPFDRAEDIPRLLHGVNIEGGRGKAESVRVLAPMVLRVVLRQGLKRQIRLMLYKLGYEVKRLVRMRIGGLRLTGLREGEWRALTAAEVTELLAERPQASKEKAAGAKPARAGAGKETTEAARRSAGPAGRRAGAFHRRGERGGASSRSGPSGNRGGASAPRAGRRP